MHAALLAVLVLMADPVSSDSNAATLASQLGSTRFVEREAAERALGQLGRAALPALRAAGQSEDPEVRNRAAALVAKIESELLVACSMISLRFHDTPMTEVVRTIHRESGLRIRLAPESLPLWNERRITVRSEQPLPFWEALDNLCAAGQLHYVFGAQPEAEQGEATVTLYDGSASPQGMVADHGPFRVLLTSLHYQSELHLSHDQGLDRKIFPGGTLPAPTPRNPIRPSKQFFMQILVGAEPHLSVAPGGSVKLVEAIDNLGRSLVLPTRGDLMQYESGYLGVNSSPLVHLRVDLNFPDPPATQLKKVKGSIPLIVTTRRPGPVEIALANASNKLFQQNGVEIRVGDVRFNQPDQVATIELSVKNLKASREGEDRADPDDVIRSIASPQQLEVLDAAGHVIPWFPSSSFFTGEEANLTLTLLDREGPSVPTTLRYHAVIRDQIEVPFEFRHLPMP